MSDPVTDFNKRAAMDDALATIERLTAEKAAMEKDAERYRWLPIESAPDDDRILLLMLPTNFNKRTPHMVCSGRRFDAGGCFVIFNADEAIQRVEPTHWAPHPDAAMGETP